MTDEILIVNDQDKIVGFENRAKAHRLGLWHRIVCIYVLNSRSEIFMQKRGPNVELHPNLWDHSAAGHVDRGEEVLTAAKRELFEELGIKTNKLEQIAYHKRQSNFEDKKLNRFWYLFKITYDGPVKLQQEELAGGKFVSIDWLKNDMKNNSQNYTNGFIKSFEEFLKQNK